MNIGDHVFLDGNLCDVRSIIAMRNSITYAGVEFRLLPSVDGWVDESRLELADGYGETSVEDEY